MSYSQSPSELLEVNGRLLVAGLREQKMADELRKHLAFTIAITSSLSEGICALDQHGQITFANPAVSRMLGWSESSLRGRLFHRLVHRTCDGDCAFMCATRAESGPRECEDEFLRWNGERFPVACTISALDSRDDNSGTVITFRDVTEQNRLVASERAARAQVDIAAQLRIETLSMVVHDLRTPLTAVKGIAQLLARGVNAGHPVAPEMLQKALGQIDDSSERMIAVLSELLDIAFIQEGRSLTLQTHDVDLVALVRKVLDEQQAIAPTHVMTLTSTGATLYGVWDDLRLERVVSNLLSNAVSYSPPDRAIDIRLWHEHDEFATDWAVLEIRDEGVGIPAAELPLVFERFHRGSNVSGRIAGTGLGLSGAKRIIEQHGGTITIRSVEHVGTNVTVRLPLK